MKVTKPSARIISLRFLPALLWMGVIFYVSSLPRLEAPDEVQRVVPLPVDVVGHLGEYGVLGVFLTAAFSSGRWRWGAALVIAFLYGVSDELHQAFVPGREASWEDILFDALGAALGVGVFWAATRPFRLRGRTLLS